MKSVLLKFSAFAVILSLLFIVCLGGAYGGKTASAAALSKDFTASEESSDTTVKQNAVVLVEFDDGDSFSDGFSKTLENTFNDSPESVQSYFSFVSSGKVDFSANILTTKIKLDHSQSYYMPMYEYSDGAYTVVNEDGYDNRYFDGDGNVVESSASGAKQHVDRFYREQQTVREIVKKAVTDDSFTSDGEGDGVCDGLCIVFCVDGSAIYWNDILWAHRASLMVYNETEVGAQYYIPDDYEVSAIEFLPVKLNGDTVENYIVLTTLSLEQYGNLKDENNNKIFGTGVICHELMHDFGVADYYSYESTGEEETESVGVFDIMGGSTALPSMPLSYTRYTLGWLDDDDILPVEGGGTYKLYPTSSDGDVKAYKLVLSDYCDTGEYFMIEARSNSESIADLSVSDAKSAGGIIVYRVNEENAFTDADGSRTTINYGNMYGEDSVYVYRLGGGSLSGSYTQKSYALLDGSSKESYTTNSGSGRTYIDRSTIGNADKSADRSVIDENTGYITTSLCYSDGTNSGIVISDVSAAADGGYEFTISFEDEVVDVSDITLSKYYDRKSSVVTWYGGLPSGQTEVYVYPAEGLVKYSDGAYVQKTAVSAEEVRSGTLNGGNLLYSLTVSSSYRRAFLPVSFDEPAAVYIVFTGTDGNLKAEYCGVISPRDPSFAEYFFGTTQWRLLFIGIVGALVASTIIGVVLIVKQGKKAQVATTAEDEDLSSVYGENYWEKSDGDGGSDTADSNAQN